MPLLLLLGAPALAAAHELWVERAPQGFAVHYGHRGGEALPIDRAQVKAIRCTDAAGASTDLLPRATFAPTEVRIGGACAAVSVLYDAGYWSVTPDGKVHLPKDRVRDVVRSWSSRYLARWVDARAARAGAVQGDALELVPASDLARARPGDAVTLRALSAGQPVPGAAVEDGHRALGRTDARGEVRFRVPAAAVVSVSAWIRRPKPTPQADAELLEASLTFEVGR